MISLAIFDLDKVLCHYDMDQRIALLAERLGRPADVIRGLWLDSGWEAAAEAGRYPDGEAYLAAFNDLFAAALTVSEWCAIRRRAMAPNRPVLALAARVKGRAAAITLTNNGPLLRENLAVIAPEVAEIFGPSAHASADFGARKPDSAVFERALARYGARPGEAVFVDDDIANVEAARALGIDAHHFDGADRLADFLGDRRLV